MIPPCDFTIFPSIARVGATITFTDTTNAKLITKMAYGDGRIFIVENDSERGVFKHIYTKEGKYSVIATTDKTSDGIGVCTKEITVYASDDIVIPDPVPVKESFLIKLINFILTILGLKKV